MKKICLLLMIPLLAAMTAAAQRGVEEQHLAAGWQLHADKGRLIPAVVPGDVYTDLMRAKVIPDPFIGSNELGLQWVGQRGWNYSLTFDVRTEVWSKKQIILIFKGLDTYAEVFLNGQKILTANNQFREWRCDVKGVIKLRGNKLEVRFRSPFAVEDSLRQGYGVAMPGGNRVFTRKGQWQYGWDWAPALPSMGIWQPVILEGFDHYRLMDVRVNTTFSQGLPVSSEGVFEIESFATQEVILAISHASLLPNETSVTLVPGVNTITIPMEFADPVQLWWPVGLGTQMLYDFQFKVIHMASKTLIQQSLVTGIRQVELVREPDWHGESFFFRINGVPVFMKGANWVPMDHFPSRVTTRDYIQMLDEVSFAGMNMLRVWGGGIYEQELFYRLCDERGIMVWQDFMFACGMYPGDEEMLQNIRSEAEQQVVRLEKHPSVVLWCGNNEVSEGWHRWGWPSDYPSDDSARIWHDYLKIFHSLLPEIVSSKGSGVPYWPSSPSLGRGDPAHMLSGDAHYWGVWHDAEPFQMFRRRVPRFMSEFGFQSYPAMSTLRKFAEPLAMKPDSEVMLVHQKHPRGNQLIDSYMKDWFREPADFDQYVHYSQLLQAEGMAVGILAHREAKPWCMGTLYWQLNDCWPAVSWSSVDYYGVRKALHYKAREVFAPTIATVTLRQNTAEIILINDFRELKSARVVFEVMDHQGKVVFKKELEGSAPTETNQIWRIALPDTLPGQRHIREMVFRTRVYDGLQVISDRITLPARPKQIKFSDAVIQHTTTKTATGFQIRLRTDVFAYGVMVSIEEAEGTLSDNFFCLIPGEEKIITFSPTKPTNALKVKAVSY